MMVTFRNYPFTIYVFLLNPFSNITISFAYIYTFYQFSIYINFILEDKKMLERSLDIEIRRFAAQDNAW